MNKIEIETISKKLKISHFLGVFTGDNLPAHGSRGFETAIVNLDDSEGPGAHWAAYVERLGTVDYYDSFGNLKPPRELLNYFSNNLTITYNYKVYQGWNESKCGQLYLKFLNDKTNIYI